MHHRSPTMPSMEAFELALSLLGREDVDEDQAEQVLADAGVEYWQMRRLLVWLPEAFALAVLGHSEGITLPRTFTARDEHDCEHSLAFGREPLFAVAVRRALQIQHEGPRAQLKAIAQRSSTMDAVNSALHAGVELNGATLSGPQLLDIKAETYFGQDGTAEAG
ncbi:TPA: hypothetical protein QDZ42_004281 [Stenotrophomonas maltophilia]|nr:hypothetical protein [Stenotrophomonas maltophilia]HDS1041348.1 hypothetical protein [Stenotrophomonas maltophilia]HDS1041676.1 hypothetical protein [Stenotrophomonas maltophilia]HDS1045580.1 hypothetical protein [Stenotrophomonas maltophilia]